MIEKLMAFERLEDNVCILFLSGSEEDKLIVIF